MGGSPPHLDRGWYCCADGTGYYQLHGAWTDFVLRSANHREKEEMTNELAKFTLGTASMSFLRFLSLCLTRDVLYLVDDVLILALGLEVHLESTDGSDDTSTTTAPEKRIAQVVTVSEINLVYKPAKP